MRARHRHFNYAALGATAVYDARFLALNNNDAVSTWTDRSASGNDATETGATRPTYKTNQINGQPTIQFTGNNKYLTLTTGITVAASSETLIVNWKATLGNRVIALAQASDSGSLIGDFQDDNFYAFTTGAGRWAGSTSVVPKVVMVRPDNFILFNGIAQSTTGTSGGNGVVTRIGQRNSQGSVGHIGLIAHFGSALTAASRKRAQHHAAYSYKIACS